MASRDGAFACLRRRSSNCTLSNAPATTRSAEQKKSQTASAAAMGDSADAGAAFVADMEDVPEFCHRPRDPARPLVCLDETSKQLIVETRTPIRAKPGHPQRHDYEYERNGVANRFMLFAPLEGWRHVKVKLPSIMPTCSGNYPTCIFPTQQRSCWCRIISTPTSPPRFTKPSPPPSASARRALRMAAEGRVGADFQAE